MRIFLILLVLGGFVSSGSGQPLSPSTQFLLTFQGGAYQASNFDVTSIRLNTDENDLFTPISPLDGGLHAGAHFRVFPDPHWGGGLFLGYWTSKVDAQRFNLPDEQRLLSTKVRSLPVLFEGFYRITSMEPTPLYPYVGLGLGFQSVKWTYDQVDIDFEADPDELFEYHVEATARPITYGVIGGMDYSPASGLVAGILLSILATNEDEFETTVSEFRRNGILDPSGPSGGATVDGSSWPRVGGPIRSLTSSGVLEGKFGGLGMDFYIGYQF